jgi:hypothetical protein
VALVLYAPFAWAGYGSDYDAHGVIERPARTLIEQHQYLPSRYPGYFVQEVGEAILNWLGGSVLANLGTVAMALASLWFLLRILRSLNVPHPRLLTLIMAVHPVFWITSATTIDYLWALALLLAGLDAWLRKRAVWSGLLFGLAVGARLSSVFVALVLFAFHLWRGPADARRRALQMAVAGGICGALLYVPAWHAAGNSLEFFQYSIGKWGWKAYAGRFIYKNIYFWGLLAFLVFLPLALLAIRRTLTASGANAELLIPLLLIIAYEGLFLKVPLERGYLLPSLPFWLILLGRTVSRPALIALLLSLILCDFVNVNLARPDVPDQASKADVGLWVERGPIIDDTVKRCALTLTRRHDLTPAEASQKHENLWLCRTLHLVPAGE